MINECPDSLREVKLDVLRMIVEIYPQSLQVRDNEHRLPIHIAAKYQGASFCKVLIDRYPESLRLGCEDNVLPFHVACESGLLLLESVKYIFEADRDFINAKTNYGFYPIHKAVGGGSNMHERDQVEIVRFLWSVILTVPQKCLLFLSCIDPCFCILHVVGHMQT